jgi:signal transduction histidine kinase
MPKACVMKFVGAGMTLRTRLAVAVMAAAGFTALVFLTPVLEPGARNRALHVALETAGSVVAVLAAVLVYGRFGRSLLRSDLVLTTALVAFAAANLGFSTVPALVSGTPEAPAAWGGVLARGLAVGLMTAAAFMPPHEVRRPRHATYRWLGACGLALAAIAAAVALAGDALPAPVTLGSVPGEALAGHPVITALEGAFMIAFGGAALGFARRAGGSRDDLVAWLAIAAVFGTFARLHYVVYPSVLTDWFAAGDILRLAFFMCLLAGGVAEIRLAQRALTATAVLGERQRIARDMHDGTAQDLAFILQQGRRLAEREPFRAELEQIVTAAGHALDNTRNVLADLFRPSDEPLAMALQRTAEEIAAREGVRADVAGAADLRVPPTTRDALCNLVREAVTNAIRHGGASTVRVTVQEAPELQITITDDGCGFDVEAVRGAAGHFGLVGMDQRAALLGGELRVSSSSGTGTEVRVILP